MSKVQAGQTSAGAYAIRVQGRLDARWATWFDGCTLTVEADGTTVITGTVVDQAALHGLLQALRDLGLPLLSVTPLGTDPGPDVLDPPQGHKPSDLAIPAQEDVP